MRSPLDNKRWYFANIPARQSLRGWATGRDSRHLGSRLSKEVSGKNSHLLTPESIDHANDQMGNDVSRCPQTN